jgi:hypothetical protein
MTQQADEVLAVGFGLLLLVPGPLMVTRPAWLANTTPRAPGGCATTNAPAYPGRTTPGFMRRTGIILCLVGLGLLAMAVLGTTATLKLN